MMGDVSLSDWYKRMEGHKAKRELELEARKEVSIRESSFVPDFDEKAYFSSSRRRKREIRAVRMSEDLRRWVR